MNKNSVIVNDMGISFILSEESLKEKALEDTFSILNQFTVVDRINIVLSCNGNKVNDVIKTIETVMRLIKNNDCIDCSIKLYLVKYGTKYICMEALYDFLSKEAEGIFDMGAIVNRDEKDFIDIYIDYLSIKEYKCEYKCIRVLREYMYVYLKSKLLVKVV